MNKLEKLNHQWLAAQTLREDLSTAAATGHVIDHMIIKLNEAIDHITALEAQVKKLTADSAESQVWAASLESEVDRLKGHDHTSYNLRDLPPSLQKQVIDATPPTMETDKQ